MRRKALWQDHPPAKLASLALERTKLALQIGYGTTPISESARSVRKLDLDQAAAELKLAIALGFSDMSMLRNHRDSWAFPALCDWDDVKRLIQDLERPRADAQATRKKSLDRR